MDFLLEVITGVAIAVVAAIIINFLGLNGSKSVVMVHGGKASKKWKTLIVLSWIAGVVGLLLLFIGIPNGGMENPSTQWGITLIAVSLCFEIIGKFCLWWNRNW